MQKTATARRSGSPRRKPRSYHCSPQSWLPRPNLTGSLSKRQDLGGMPLPRSLLPQVPAGPWCTSSVILPKPSAFFAWDCKGTLPQLFNRVVFQLMILAPLAKADRRQESSDQGPTPVQDSSS